MSGVAGITGISGIAGFLVVALNAITFQLYASVLHAPFDSAFFESSAQETAFLQHL